MFSNARYICNNGKAISYWRAKLLSLIEPKLQTNSGKPIPRHKRSFNSNITNLQEIEQQKNYPAKETKIF